MKTVLIPTDFSVESIRIIDSLSFTHKLENVTFIFLHAFKLSDSISDMLLLSRRSRDYQNISQDFYNELEVYKKKHPDLIRFIGIEYFYGSTVVAFKNLLETLAVDTILYPNDYFFRKINKYSIDPKLLTSRCGCPVVTLELSIVSNETLFDTKIPENTIEVVNV